MAFKITIVVLVFNLTTLVISQAAQTAPITYTNNCPASIIDNTIKGPQAVSECTKYTDQHYYCCIIKPVENTNNPNPKINTCYSIANSDFNADSIIKFNNFDYYVDCGLTSTMGMYSATTGQGDTCGNSDIAPYQESDCGKYSTNFNSCCYYYTSTGGPGCLWLGAKYSGKTIYNGQILSCFSEKLNFPLFLISIFILTFIF
jgi:hypothetical protein